ncbi:MAG: hypothetical protein H6833_11985, partial [Planctomycetes bacterium]|nr:hypothetical protein [Planctomycetota bacterium]
MSLRRKERNHARNPTAHSPQPTAHSIILGSQPIRWLLSAAFLCVTGIRSASAQGPEPTDRTEFVFHVYVDPIHGDDALASNQHMGMPPPPWFNPLFAGGSSAKNPLSTHPVDPTWTTLQHAPFSFKTVTAAVTALTVSFPWTLPNSNRKVTRAVIHCLPGLYGRGIGPGVVNRLDPRTGLRFNGDILPINLTPEKISIQGSGALNTIFDCERVTASTAFVVPAGSIGERGRKRFIDGICVRGARSGSVFGPAGSGVSFFAGVGGENQSVLSNCILTDNDVGVAIDGRSGAVASPIIVNCTIAANRIGIWSGDFQALGSSTTGYARPRILNSILDARDLFGQWTSTSAFEGLHNNDLTVVQIGAQAVTIDFNAYDTTMHSFGTAFGSWIATTPRSTPGTYSPRVAIDTFECLYVNEVFWKHQGALMSPAIFENGRSPHDFRLAPIVTAGGFTGPLNPLVNKGIDTSAGTLRFANYAGGLAPDIVDPPGMKGPGPQSQGNDV